MVTNIDNISKNIIQYYTNINIYVNKNQKLQLLLNDNNYNVPLIFVNSSQCLNIKSSNYLFTIISLSIFSILKTRYKSHISNIYELCIGVELLKLYIENFNINNNSNKIYQCMIKQYLLSLLEVNAIASIDLTKKDKHKYLSQESSQNRSIIDEFNYHFDLLSETFNKIDKYIKNLNIIFHSKKHIKLTNNLIKLKSDINNKNIKIIKKVPLPILNDYVNNTYCIIGQLYLLMINSLTFNNKNKEKMLKCGNLLGSLIKIYHDFINIKSDLDILMVNNLSFNYIINYGFSYAYNYYNKCKQELYEMLLYLDISTSSIEYVITAMSSYIELQLKDYLPDDISLS